MTNRFLGLWVFVALFSAIFLVYSPNVRGIFISDDYVWIAPMSWSQVKHDFTGSWEHGNTLRPIMRLQFFSSRVLFGENPVGWHITNFFLHTLVAFCLYLIAKKITGNTTLAFVTSLIFAVFPTNHETVAWISGRTHPFGFLLSLLSFYLIYLSFSVSKFRYWQMISGYFVLLLAFLTYEVSFAVPLALLLAVFIFDRNNRRAFYIALGTFGVLAALVAYRFQVLGGNIGSVGQHQSNIFLAPFLNFHQLEIMYFYARDLKFIIFFLCLFLLILVYKNKLFDIKNKFLIYTIYFLPLSVLFYLPFSIVKGVAPRFLYSSIFFFCLAAACVYELLKNKLSKNIKNIILVWALAILFISVLYTYRIAQRYKEVSDTYEKIAATVLKDFPQWPPGKDMVFYGLYNGNQEAIAFITYFDKFLKRYYPAGVSGNIYRAQELSVDQLNKVLSRGPIIYRLNNFGEFPQRIK